MFQLEEQNDLRPSLRAQGCPKVRALSARALWVDVRHICAYYLYPEVVCLFVYVGSPPEKK